jgi:hypothetical protein
MRFSPRTIVLAAAVIVAIGLLIASRFAGGGGAAEVPYAAPASSGTATTPGTAGTSAAPAAGPTATRPAADDGDDGADVPPVLVQPTGQPGVQEAGTQFAAAWLNTYGQTAANWVAGLTPRVTPDLAGDLADADPASVPAGGKVSGKVLATADGSLYNVVAPVVTADAKAQPLGTLTLTMIHKGGTWLVSEIDWQAAP